MPEKEEKEKAETHIAVFNGKTIRRKLIDDKWFFSIVDIVGVLIDNERPRKYWFDLKNKLIEEGFELSDFIGQLKLKSGDGKEYKTDCADTEGIFRIIQSIPSKKAEPFKRWLAKVGYERVQEIENPELAKERMKKLKNLKRENLRDHMDDLELIFTMLGEAATTRIAKSEDVEGLEENKTAAKQGGEVAGNARKELEEKTGESIVTEENFLDSPEKLKKKRKKLIESAEILTV